MARGAKPGERRGGRAKGTTNKATEKRREVAMRALEEGISPLDVMLRTMRSEWNLAQASDGKLDAEHAKAACSIAKECAPYVHPRLAAVEHSGDFGLKGVSDADLAAEFENLARAAGYPLAGQGDCKPQDSKAGPRKPH